MNCSEVSERICAYADGELPLSIREAVEAHVEECPRCRDEAARLVANVAFMKRTMAVLGAGTEEDASFLTALRPRTRAEVAAAEREAIGAPPTHRLRNALIAIAILAAAVVGYVVVSGSGTGGDGTADQEKGGKKPDRASTAPARSDPSTAGEPRTNRPDVRRPAPHNTVRVVPPKRDQAGSLADLPMTLARALRKRDAATMVPRLVQQASVRLRTPEQVATLRGLVPTAATPEVMGLLLIVLGSGPGPATSRPLLLTHLRSDPSFQVRAAAAIALCRPGRHDGQVTYLERFRLPVAKSGPEVTGALLRSLESESETSVKHVIIDLVGPTARTDEEVALTLARLLATESDEGTLRRLLAALGGANHAPMATPLSEWIQSGSVPVPLLGAALGLLQSLDRAKAREVAAGLLGNTQDASARRALLSALAGGLADAETFRLVAEILRSDPDASVRLDAVHLVASAPAESARPLLREIASSDADENVRRSAEGALEALKEAGEKPAGDGTVEGDD